MVRFSYIVLETLSFITSVCLFGGVQMRRQMKTSRELTRMNTKNQN